MAIYILEKGKHLEDVSSYANLDAHFQNTRSHAEKIILNFETLESFEYNCPFTKVELDNALRSCNSSAQGHDNI